MVKLKQMIKNECEKDKSLAGKLAKLIGYSSASPLYKFLNEEDREIDFEQILKVVQYLFSDREFELMSEYILTLNPCKRCARESLEYTNINKLNEVFEELLVKLSECKNKESNEWASVYKLNHDVVNGKIKRLDAIEKLNGMTFKTDEMQSFSKIIQFYYYHDLRLIDIMNEMSILIENSLNNIKDGFVKVHYECRFVTIISAIYLHTNKVNELRTRINELIEKITNHNLLNIMYVIIGNSHIIDNYDVANDYYEKALFHANQVNNVFRINQTNKSINLLNSVWKKKKEFIEIDEDENSMMADYAFNRCNYSKEEALKILNNIDKSSFSNYGMGYYYYYLGMATGNEDYFFESIENFNKVGEKFFKQLPLIELEKMGVKKSIIKALSV